jgi:hypothetical protein
MLDAQWENVLDAQHGGFAKAPRPEHVLGLRGSWPCLRPPHSAQALVIY